MKVKQKPKRKIVEQIEASFSWVAEDIADLYEIPIAKARKFLKENRDDIVDEMCKAATNYFDEYLPR